MKRLVTAASAGAAVLTAHSVVNAQLLRRPPRATRATDCRVTVVLPVRDEASRVEPCLRSILAQQGVLQLAVVVVDDASTDGTSAVVREIADTDPRVRIVQGTPLPTGWLGKAWACQQGADAVSADAATSDVLVFVDADVVLAPHAIASCVALLHDAGLDFVSPYPRQLTETVAERLVQPLLQWSWLTLLPLRVSERSPRPSLSAANGQLLAVRRSAYLAAGDHRAVRADVLEDVALARRVKAIGGRGGIVDGTGVATCRMYTSWGNLRDGYAKSLWAAGGTPWRSAAQVGALGLLYVLPPLAALHPRTRRAGVAGYAAGVASRVVAAARTGGRLFPDPLAHPISVAVFGWLTALSWHRHRLGTATWKSRPLP